MNPHPLQDKVAVVSGAGQGIGAAIAKAMAAAGAQVLVNDIQADKAAHTVKVIREAGGIAEADGTDISTFNGADALIDRCLADFDAIDILVNNAGILRDRMSFNTSATDWDAVIAVCLTGTFACSRAAVRWLREEKRPGRIINLTSRSGLRGSVGQTNYAAAKAGVLGITRTMALEVIPYGITVNAISPRAETAMTASIPADVAAKRDVQLSHSGVRRRGTPEEVAPVAVFLALDESAWINGQVVGIGGDKLSLWSHPTEVTEAFSFGGWSLQQLRDNFKATVGYELQSVGNKD
ncbi:MAG TPA: SDR family oxidoreductase [Burkholderiaceae bacterium]|nr:SDR family oxidoreductase [Burkholderiaceae bacterium]